MPNWSGILKELKGQEITVHFKRDYQTSSMRRGGKNQDGEMYVTSATPADGAVQSVSDDGDGGFLHLRQDIPQELRGQAGCSSRVAIIPTESIALIGVGSPIASTN